MEDNLTIENLQKKTEELQKENEELNNKHKRALADYQNLEKRFAKESNEVSRFASELLVLKSVRVLDGLEMVIKNFKEVLVSEGLEEIKVKVGDDFEATYMEALEVAEGENENKVAGIVRTGYKLNDKVVRPAGVKVVKKNSN